MLIYVLVFIPIIFGWKPLVVISGSMEPTLKVGGLLYYKKCDLNDFKKDDILVFRSSKHIVSHRIVEKKEFGFITKGDANKKIDNNVVNNSVVMGIGTNWCIPYLGYYVSFLYNNKIIMFLVISLMVYLSYKEKKRFKNNIVMVFALFLTCQFCFSFFNTSTSVTNNFKTSDYNVKLYTDGGTLINDLRINKDVILPDAMKKGSTFDGWIKDEDGYRAEWIDTLYSFKVEPIIQGVTYPLGKSGFTFTIWKDDKIIASNVKYFNTLCVYDDVFKVVVNERDGYTINSFKTKTFVIQKNTSVNPSWIDNIPPVITNFKVENLGYYNSSLGARAGWNIRIYIEGYDTGSGINKYQTWLVPYQNGSGAEREDGNNRVLTNVLYLNKPEGRTFCAYVIDNAGNESEKCETIKI